VFLPPVSEVSTGMTWLAAAVLFLMPLVLAPRLLFYYDVTPKVTLLFAGAALAGATTLKTFDSVRALAGTRTGRTWLAAVALWMGANVLAAFFSPYPELAWHGSNWRRMGLVSQFALVLLAIWTAAVVRDAPARKVLFRAMTLTGLLASVYGIVQFFGWDPLIRPSAYRAGEGIFQIVRPPATFGHSDYFAAYLLWPVFSALGSLRVEQSRSWRYLAGLATGGGTGAIILSGSRGALLGLLTGGIACLFLLRPRLSSLLRCGVIGAVILAALFFTPAGQPLRARLHWIGEDRTGGARLLLWRDSLTMAAHRPWIGVGPDNFVAEFPQFQSEQLARAYPDFLQESPHNFLLDTVTESGIFGLIALLLMIGAAIAGGWQQRASAWTASMVAGLLACIVAQQFVVFTVPTAFPFFVFTVLLAASGSAQAHACHALALRGFAFAAGLVIAAIFGFASYRITAADRMLARVRHALDDRDANMAAELYRQALSHNGAGVSADLYFSRRWSEVADATPEIPKKLYYAQIALGSASRAAGFPEQRQNAWYNLSLLLAPTNDAAAVEQALRNSIAAAPNWYKPHWTLARLLALEGRREEALVEARRALYLNGAKDPEVTYTVGHILSSVLIEH
jgi:O-antigen ligase